MLADCRTFAAEAGALPHSPGYPTLWPSKGEALSCPSGAFCIYCSLFEGATTGPSIRPVATGTLAPGLSGQDVPPLWRLVARGSKTIISLGGADDSCPLYLVHSLAGEVTSLRRLGELVSADRAVYGIQATRERMRRECTTSIKSIAGYYVEALSSQRPSGPLFLGGWSAGAVIALEMAQILRRRGRDVRLLIVLDGRLRNVDASMSAWNPGFYLSLARGLPRWLFGKLADGWRAGDFVHGIGRGLRSISASLTRSGRRGASTKAVEEFLEESHWGHDENSFARSLFDALGEYSPEYYSGPVSVYEADAGALINRWHVGLAWRKVSKVVAVTKLGAKHDELTREPHVSALASDLRKQLQRFAANPSASAGTRGLRETYPGLFSAAGSVFVRARRG